MTDTTRLKALKVALVAVGVIAIVGIYPLMLLWPSGFAWHTGHSDYPLMIAGIYATLGVFLIAAARDPLANRSLIGFTIWSSVVHGLIMAVQSFTTPDSHTHMLGDVPALFVIASVLAFLMPRGARQGKPSGA